MTMTNTQAPPALPGQSAGIGNTTAMDRIKAGYGKGIFGRGGVGGFGIAVGIWTGLGYFSDSDPNKKFTNHLGSAIGWELLLRTAPGIGWVMLGFHAAKGATSWYKNTEREKKKQYNLMFRSNFGGNYQDSRQAMTMRQAGVQAIQASHLNGRSLLGQEASLMHR